MPVFVVRIWLSDRPGSLGAVASSIGSIGGDLVGIDILERGGGKAIDELIVELPDTDFSRLLTELGRVPGVDVEDIRPINDGALDPRLDALDTAIELVESHSVDVLLKTLAMRGCRDFEAEWSAVIDADSPEPLASVGRAPSKPWIAAFLSGSRASVRVAAGDTGPNDVAWAPLSAADLTLVMGRDGRPFRSRERRQATALARIADARWVALVR
jgi:hypothetical protein